MQLLFNDFLFFLCDYYEPILDVLHMSPNGIKIGMSGLDALELININNVNN